MLVYIMHQIILSLSLYSPILVSERLWSAGQNHNSNLASKLLRVVKNFFAIIVLSFNF